MSYGYEQHTLEKLRQVEIDMLEAFIGVCEKFELKYFMAFGSAIGVERHQGFIPWDDDIDVGMLREDYEKFCTIWEKELGDKYELINTFNHPEYACTVTHLQKRGTRFITPDIRNATYEIGINIDIFVFDAVSDDEKMRKKQIRRCWWLGRLLFLTGSATPVIQMEGKTIGSVKKKILQMGCCVVHYLFKIFRITPSKIYQLYYKNATACRGEDTKYLIPFESAKPIRERLKTEYLFPLQKKKFERLEVNVPNQNQKILYSMYGDFMRIPPEEERVNHVPLEIDFGEE